MFDSVLRVLRQRIRDRLYVVTTHAEEEMEDDGLGVYDLEHVVLSGDIVERQRDVQTSQWKYRLRGTTISRSTAAVVVRLGPTGKVVFITVYAL